MKNNMNFNNENIKNKVENNFNGSIRDIEVPERSYSRENKFKEINLEGKKSTLFKKIWLLVLFLGVISGAISYFFHSASFEIKNLVKEISFKNDIIKSNNINPKVGEEIPFKLLNFDVSFEKDLKSQMVEEVSEKSIGKIKIINNSNKVQKLRKETRFEVDGKIFKTYKSVTIPAKKYVIKEAFADVAGEEYNLKKGLKMVIPGFKEVKDMDSYKKITGEIAEDFKGGLVGKRDIPDSDDLEQKKKELARELESTIMVKARTNLPKGFILNNDGVFKEVKYSTKNINNSLKLIADAKVNIIIFNEKDFLSVVSGLKKEKIDKYNVESTAFLKFKILNKKDISVESLKSFNFELNGDLKYSKKFDKDDFVNLIKGKNESEYKILIEKNYNKDDFSIDKSVFPFWMSSIPNSTDNISVKILE